MVKKVVAYERGNLRNTITMAVGDATDDELLYIAKEVLHTNNVQLVHVESLLEDAELEGDE